MPSSLTWLDYSERDRRRALDVVDLFKETGTVDELGLGSIRDSFSDLFFPGTSTIQTRACYFLLLPWTFLRMERKRIPSNKATEWARTEELRINDRLLQCEDDDGVFGKVARWNLKRLPSDAYWGGLGSWGIRLFPGYGYYQSLDRFYRDLDAAKNMPYDPEGRRSIPANWHPHVPDPPHSFPYQGVSTALRRQDAEYLRDRIQSMHAGSLLAVLAGRADEEDLEADWPWELARRAEVTPVLREQLDHAKRFAIALHGAALLYNLMLAEERGDGERVDGYREQLEDWATDADSIAADLASWRLEDIWVIARSEGRALGFPTRVFVERWLAALRERGPRAAFAVGSPTRALVRDREIQLKGPRARLASRRHLELWGGQSGSQRMDYRWKGTKVILRDIFDGLARSEGDAGDA